MLVVHFSHPQPAWQSARVFAAHYHAIQSLPFFCGFLLVTGCVMLVASLHALADGRLRPLTLGALVFTSAFAALVLLNYAVQTTFVPRLAEHYAEANGPTLSAFTMSQPSSLGWSLEMWGYAWLGVATWLVSPVLSKTRLERVTARLFAANGPLSLLAALWNALDAGWVMSPSGLVAFAVWNVLVVGMAVLACAALRARLRADDSL